MPADPGQRRSGMRHRDPPPAGSAGVSRFAARRRPCRPPALLSAGPQQGRLRGRHPAGAAGDARQSAVRLPPRAGAGDAARRPGVPHRRPRPRVAALVLSLGHAARRRAREGRHERQLEDHDGLQSAVAPDARRSARGSAVDAIRGAVAAAAGHQEEPPGSAAATRSGTTRWPTASAARPRCSSTVSSARIATCSTC